MNKPKDEYGGLNDILKQLNQKNNEIAKNLHENTPIEDIPIQDTPPSVDNSFLSLDKTPVSTDTQDVSSWPTTISSLYSEHMIENNATSVVCCYMDYTKDNQKCVLMVYKNPTEKEKIICASFDMDTYVEVIEKTIEDLGRNTDLVYVIGWAELTLDTTEEIIDIHGTNDEVWILSDTHLYLCKKIISQHLFGHGVEKISAGISEEMFDTFNGNLNNEQKAKAIIMLCQQMLSHQSLIDNHDKDMREQRELRQKMKQQWDMLMQYAQDLDTEIPKGFVSEMQQCIRITDNDSQLSINDYKTFAWIVVRYGLEIAILYPTIFHQ